MPFSENRFTCIPRTFWIAFQRELVCTHCKTCTYFCSCLAFTPAAWFCLMELVEGPAIELARLHPMFSSYRGGIPMRAHGQEFQDAFGRACASRRQSPRRTRARTSRPPASCTMTVCTSTDGGLACKLYDVESTRCAHLQHLG